VSELDPTLEPKPVEIRRLEVITGAGSRRRWLAEKTRIVQEVMAPGAVVSVIARRHGLTPQ
jgi:transposase